jgi:mannose-1-phosphate guanylyltransferase
MPLHWLDVGSWPAFATTCPSDGAGNALGTNQAIILDTRGTLVASSDPGHLIAALGCDDLMIIHTPDATLVCRKDRAESIKELHREVGRRFGSEFL